MQSGSLPQNMLENRHWRGRQLEEEQLGWKVTESHFGRADRRLRGRPHGMTSPCSPRVRVYPAAHLRKKQKFLQALQTECSLLNQGKMSGQL